MNKEYLKLKGYDFDKIIMDTLMDAPTMLKDVGELYPIKVKDYSWFNELYSKFIVIGQEYLGIENESEYISSLIFMSAYEKQAKIQNKKTYNGAFEKISNPLEEIKKEKEEEIKFNPSFINEALIEMIEMLEFLFKADEVVPLEQGFEIHINGVTTLLKNSQYGIFRQIVMLQNGLTEPKRYEDEILEEWVNKAKQARQRKDITFNDLMVVVKNEVGTSYKEVAEMPILQFYVDYHWQCHIKEYEALTMFRTVSSKVPSKHFVENVINNIYKQEDSELFMGMEAVTSKLD